MKNYIVKIYDTGIAVIDTVVTGDYIETVSESGLILIKQSGGNIKFVGPASKTVILTEEESTTTTTTTAAP